MKENNTKMNQTTKNRIITGLFIAGYGMLLFASRAFALIPDWIFSWPMFLIAFGFYSGLKNDFKNMSWAVIMLTGGFFLIERILHISILQAFTVPVLLVLAGIYLITSPSKRKKFNYRRQYMQDNEFNF